MQNGNENFYVKFEDLTPQHEINRQDLPYLESIGLDKFKPGDFGLNKWLPNFTLSDKWMRRIYKSDAYHDTDLPAPNQETFSLSQLRIINDYVKKRQETEKIPEHPSRSKNPPQDDLLTALRRNVKNSNEKSDLPNMKHLDHSIAKLRGHKIQPTNWIIEQALAKTICLSEDQEKFLAQLIRNDNFMNGLNQHVKDYLDNNQE